MSNTDRAEDQVVSVTRKGQATIPKRLRERHGISSPGRVRFVETDDGELVVRPVGSMREFRGLERSGGEDRPGTEVLRESRDRDRNRDDELIGRFTDEPGDE
jgi:antitoxin PrlF